MANGVRHDLRHGAIRSCVCTQEQLESDTFRAWVAETREPFRVHRKCWEFAFIAEALSARGMLAPGRRGLAFGVGREPLVAMFAARGCRVVATDQDEERAGRAGWIETGQHTASLDALNERGICDPERFRRLVSFRTVDMNAIPGDLRGFDFTWSACSFEHLGSIERGLRFVERQMDCLRPGGIAVHTTEFNVSSNEETIDNHPFAVLFRRRDIEELARRLTERGHEIELDFTMGSRVADEYVDLPPYPGSSWGPDAHGYHLKLRWDRFVTTSIGLVIRKGRVGPFRRALRRMAGWHATPSAISGDKSPQHQPV